MWAVSRFLNMREHHFWPLIPGTILTLVGVGLTLDMFTRELSEYVIPAIVVVIGVILVLVGYLRSTDSGSGVAS